MVATGGSNLLESDATTILKEGVFPIAIVLTPNILGAQILYDMKIYSHDDVVEAAKNIGKRSGPLNHALDIQSKYFESK